MFRRSLPIGAKSTKPGIHACGRAAILAVVLVSAGCAVKTSPLNIEAARTEARVKTALVNDPLIGTRMIDVRVTGGVVQLSGRVRSRDEADRAVAFARAVPGVSEVISRVEVGANPSPDAAVDRAPIDSTRGPAQEFAELEEARGVFAVGAAVNLSRHGGESRVALSPLIKVGSDVGLGLAIAFDWSAVRLAFPDDERSDAGDTRLRPFMAGLRYTRPVGRLAVSPSVVAGYSINSLSVPDAGDTRGLPVAVSNSLVWRPGVSVWIKSGRHTAINLSIGRLITRPDVTFVIDGQLRTSRVTADTTIATVGVVYHIF
jgi:hypothetical protein